MAIAKKIIQKDVDYVFAVRDNQKTLRKEVESTKPLSDYSDKKRHGRIKTRRCQVFEKGLIVDFEGRWEKLQSIIKITSTQEIRNKVTTEEHYYISSLDTKLPFNTYIRNHCIGL